MPKDGFLNYPEPSQGPEISYAKKKNTSNPVLRGLMVPILTQLVVSVKFVRDTLWKINGFTELPKLKELDYYKSRHDPTVIPCMNLPYYEEVSSLAKLPSSNLRLDETKHYTTADYTAAYQSGKLTPSDVVEYLLPLIQRDTSPPGKFGVVFLQCRPELVRAAAQASTERWKAGKPLSPLDGVPVAVKEEFDLTGYTNCIGSLIDFTDPDDKTAWCVQKWQEAGAVIIGKTNQHELGLDTCGNNPFHGTPLNPHNQGYYCGGSSTGSACAVAQGLIPIAMGTDGGGSVRVPASLCGVYGLKPSHGRVSYRSTHEIGVSVAVNGPLASNIDDLALAYRIMAQPDPNDRLSSPWPNTLVKPSEKASLSDQPKYLGVCREWNAQSDPRIVKILDETLSLLVKQHKYELVDITIPFLLQGQKAHAATIMSEVRAFGIDQLHRLTGPNKILIRVIGESASAADFLIYQKMRNLLMCHCAWLWEKYPGMLIVTPTTANAGWKIGKPSDVTDGYGVSDGDTTLKSMEYVWMANFLGNPSLSCPMGWVEGDVPVGLMATGEWGSEEQLLSFGKEFESTRDDGNGVRLPRVQGQWVDVIGNAMLR